MRIDLPGEHVTSPDGAVAWTALDYLEPDIQEETQEFLAAERDRFWVHPTDSPRRTRDVLDRDGLTFLLTDADGAIIGYDTTVMLTDEVSRELYRDQLDDHLPDLPDPTATVYHCVIAPGYRGNGYGLATATLRQAVLESDWHTDPAQWYRNAVTAPHVDFDVDPDLPDRAAPLLDPLRERYDAEAVISFSRRYETPADREAGVDSRAYRIARGIGFADISPADNGRTALVAKGREHI